MKINWTKAIGLTAAAAMLLPLAACGSSNNSSAQSNGSTEEVTLSVWAPQEDQAKDNNWLEKTEKAFEKAHSEYKITWKNDVVSEADAADTVEKDPSAAADVYMFANDQLGRLVDAGAIGEVGTNELKQVKEQNTQALIDSVSNGGKVYGVPYTTNTWFMYYDKSAFSADDIKSLDSMLAKAKVAFPMTNGWYLQALLTKSADLKFFGDGTDASKGITVDKDKLTAATKYLVSVANNPNFVLDNENSGLSDLQAGNVKAYFSGSWDAANVKEALGKNYGAAALPTYTVDGKAYQMEAFAGSKAAAYNPNAKNQKAAAQFAAFLGSSESQKSHYNMREVIPSDKTLTASDAFKNNELVQAQSTVADEQSLIQPTISAMNSWWDSAKAYGESITNKQTTADNAADKAAAWADQLAAMNK